MGGAIGVIGDEAHKRGVGLVSQEAVGDMKGNILGGANGLGGGEG